MVTEHLVLGAGLAGLSAAYHLAERKYNDWLVLEKSERVGGLCRSLEYDGFIFDQSIHVIYSADPYASGLIKKLLNDNLIIQKRESWVYSSSVYTPYPWQANTYGLPAKIIKECLMGVINSTYNNNGKSHPANFEEWCYTTFGEGFARHFMVPYNRKLWAIDLKEMTDSWIRDRVMTPSLNEVIEGALQRHKKGYGPNAVFWYPQRGGIEALPKGFLPYLDTEKIVLNTTAAKIFWKEKKIIDANGKEWGYNNLISSLPLHIILDALVPSAPQELMRAAGRLEHNIVYAVNLAVKRDNISPYHWIYFPEEKYLFYRISFPHNLSRSMAPPGWSSLTVEVSASRHRQIPTREKLVQSVIDDLKDTKIISDDDHLEVKSVLPLSPAYIIYNHTHQRDVGNLRRFLKGNDIFTCGRFGEWEYLNMDHSILSGKKAVEEIMERDLLIKNGSIKGCDKKHALQLTD